MPLAKLTKVDLRAAWPHEAYDFTKWLAQEENMQLLSEEISVQLVDIRTENAVGRFNVDILAVDEDSERTVIIENQLEYSDHRHLGQIITYAAGLNASIVIWIVKEVREEHQKAIEWLNNNTTADLSFFLIRMELWQIGDSPFAPKFHVLVQPNDWAKQLQTVQKGSDQLSETKLDHQQFWEGFVEYAKNKRTILKLGQKVRPRHWYVISIGFSKAYIALTRNTREGRLGCEVYIPKSQEQFDKYCASREEIDTRLGIEIPCTGTTE